MGQAGKGSQELFQGDCMGVWGRGTPLDLCLAPQPLSPLVCWDTPSGTRHLAPAPLTAVILNK